MDQFSRPTKHFNGDNNKQHNWTNLYKSSDKHVHSLAMFNHNRDGGREVFINNHFKTRAQLSPGKADCTYPRPKASKCERSFLLT